MSLAVDAALKTLKSLDLNDDDLEELSRRLKRGELRPGDVVYGFAGGLFGRDSYEDKIVVNVGMVNKTPWALLREEGWHDPDRLHLLQGYQVDEATKYLEADHDPDEPPHPHL